MLIQSDNELLKKAFRTVLLVFISCFFLIGKSYAKKEGQPAIDSMRTDLNADNYRNKEDSVKVKLLVKIAWEYSGIDLEQSKKFAEQALNLSLKLNYKKGMAWAYGALGDYYLDMSDFSKALEYYGKDINTAREMGDKSEMAAAWGNMSDIYLETGNHAKAIEYAEKGLKINEELGNKMNIAIGHEHLGTIYAHEGYYSKSLEQYYKALSIYEALGEQRAISKINMNIGLVFERLNDLDKALEYHTKSLKIDEQTGDQKGMASTLNSIGNVYQQKNEFQTALTCYHKALDLALKNGNKSQVAKFTANIGTVAHKQKKYKSALQYYQTSLVNFEELNDEENYARTRVVISETMLAIVHENTFDSFTADSADQYVDEQKLITNVNVLHDKNTLLKTAMQGFGIALDYSRTNNILEVMNDAYAGIADIYKTRGDYKNALAYADSARAMKDSLFSKESNEKIVKLEMKSEFDRQHLSDSLKHAAEIQAGNFKLQKQRLGLYISIAVFLAIIGLTIVFQRAKTRREKAAQQILFSRQLLEIELKALRAQMNPHFIFNCLNSIQAFILRENKLEATEYLQKFSRLIRLILDNSQKTSNTIEDEAEILGLYLDLEKLRMKSKFEYEITIADELDASFTEIPSMVIQPLVENSIWHGFSNIQYMGQLTVAFEKQEDGIRCIVEDNGVGREKSMQLKGEKGKNHVSKGMKLIEDRLKAWSQTKELHYSFDIHDLSGSEHGTRTEITLYYPHNA